jgi:hypothetical protein
MALDERKSAILNCVGLGLSYAQAEILAECSADDSIALQSDTQFQARVKFKQESLKRVLLERIIDVSEKNAAYGTSTEARWLLEKLDKERFGNGKSAEQSDPSGQAQVSIYLPDNGRARP